VTLETEQWDWVRILVTDHPGLSGGRIQANNKVVVFHPLSLNGPARFGGFWFRLFS
jgi:hypothetical protein